MTEEQERILRKELQCQFLGVPRSIYLARVKLDSGDVEGCLDCLRNDIFRVRLTNPALYELLKGLPKKPEDSVLALSSLMYTGTTVWEIVGPPQGMSYNRASQEFMYVKNVDDKGPVHEVSMRTNRILASKLFKLGERLGYTTYEDFHGTRIIRTRSNTNFRYTEWDVQAKP